MCCDYCVDHFRNPPYTAITYTHAELLGVYYYLELKK